MNQRQTFLQMCASNHFQFDQLRRAKHSSMMVLYHLHNPTAPAFTSTCNSCSREIEPGQGFRCAVCTDYDVCATCKAKLASHSCERSDDGQFFCKAHFKQFVVRRRT